MPDSTEFTMKDALTKIEEYKNYLAKINPKKTKRIRGFRIKKAGRIKKNL